MDFKDVRKLMIEKDVKYKDMVGKVPDTRGGFYNTKAGLIRAFKKALFLRKIKFLYSLTFNNRCDIVLTR